MTRLPAAMAAALLLVACDWLPIGEPELDGAWQLTSGTYDGAAIVVPDGSRITMTIEGDTIGGTAACNQYGGTFELDGRTITIGPISATEMGCDGPIMAAESAFLSALADVDTVEPSRSLHLTGPASDLQFMILPPVDDAAIVGTAWLLDSIITGDAVSSVMGAPATLRLTEDGTITGSTGCRSFDGTYTISGDEVQVTRLIVTDNACADALAAQDEHVLGVLGDGFTASVEGARLTLMAGGDGLGYLAEE